jgi:hypothetical protein
MILVPTSTGRVAMEDLDPDLFDEDFEEDFEDMVDDLELEEDDLDDLEELFLDDEIDS